MKSTGNESKLKRYFKKRRNKTFYVTAASQIVVAAQLVTVLIGRADLITEAMANNFLAVVNAILVVLATFGVINDPKQGGFEDEK